MKFLFKLFGYGFLSLLGLLIFGAIIQAITAEPKEDIGFSDENARLHAKRHFDRNTEDYLQVPNSWSYDGSYGRTDNHSQTSRTYVIQHYGTAKNRFGVEIPTRSPVYHYKVYKDTVTGKWSDDFTLSIHNYNLKTK